MAARRILFVACLNFVTIGLLSAAVGPLLPALARQTGSPLGAVGALISALFAGALIAQVIGGPLNDRLGARPVLVAGLALVAAGAAGIATSQALALTLLGGVVAGVGHGAIDLGTSVLVAVTFARRSVVALNLLNVFFGLGAAAGPAVVSFALDHWGTPLPALWLIVTLAVALVPLLLWLPLPPPATETPSTERAALAIYRAPLLWLLAGLVLLYVGLENGLGGWVAVYVQRSTALPLDKGALVASVFWGALTAGRLVAAIAGARLAALTSRTLLLASVATALLGTLALAAGAGNAGATVAAVALIGLGFGPIFPTVMAITTSAFPASPGRAVGVAQTAGSIGGIVIPWLLGLVLLGFGPHSGALFVMLGALGLLAAAWLALRRAGARSLAPARP
ncbi:MAG TPA: MFS transporter [Ktedonobacterales bacterium]|nr:MFS transporter [Ktedonobacterales bacterium]